MPEYIEREAVLNRIQKLQGTDTAAIGKKQFSEGFFLGLDEAEIVILQTPTTDVAEVKHGEWIKTDKGQKCSSCNCLSSLANANLKSVYCPWCGAKMGHDIKEKR